MINLIKNNLNLSLNLLNNFFKNKLNRLIFQFIMQDTFRHKGLRKKLVEVLISKGIKCNKVLNTINNIPRHLFLDNAFDKFSYLDKAFLLAINKQFLNHLQSLFKQNYLKLNHMKKFWKSEQDLAISLQFL